MWLAEELLIQFWSSLFRSIPGGMGRTLETRGRALNRHSSVECRLLSRQSSVESRTPSRQHSLESRGRSRLPTQAPTGVWRGTWLRKPPHGGSTGQSSSSSPGPPGSPKKTQSAPNSPTKSPLRIRYGVQLKHTLSKPVVLCTFRYHNLQC
jgi:hypothetical protein